MITVFLYNGDSMFSVKYELVNSFFKMLTELQFTFT
jgi:hypothetical protein